MTPERYVRPSPLTNAFNRVLAAVTHLGISVFGSRILAVRGRRSGDWRTTPVNLLEHDGQRYLVAPRGETQWVRNLRAAGAGELRLGRRCEAFRAVELPDSAKAPVLRAYLRKWRFEVGIFFQGVDATASDDSFARIASDYPVFRLDAPISRAS